MKVKNIVIDYKNHPAYQFKTGWRDLARAFRKQLRVFWNKILPDLKYYKLTANGEPVRPFYLSQGEIGELNQITLDYLKELELQKTKGKDFRSKVLKIGETSVKERIQKILEQNNIFEIARAYRGCESKIGDIFIQMNEPDDTDWKNHFEDYPDPPTVYMHVDSTIKWMKCLIYLTEVGPNNGPTSFVGLEQVGFFKYILRKINDKANLDATDIDTRKLFAALPKFLQRKAEFGNDVYDKKDKEYLLANERKFTSEDGNLFLFDTDIIHRGGLVKEGKRIILQVILEPQWKK